MKKLVAMAAAMFAAASSYAQCEPIPTVTNDCAMVYNVEISVKTTASKAGSIATGSVCEPGSTGVCYRVISSKSFKGYYYGCECDCESFEANTLDLFDKKTGAAIVDGGTITWDMIYRIGKSKTDVEASFSFDGDSDNVEFAAMGFGKYDAKNARVSSINGSVLAYLDTPICGDECGSIPSTPFDLCDPTTAVVEAQTIAFGTFSIKYNSSASKKYVVDGDYINSLLPDSFFQ